MRVAASVGEPLNPEAVVWGAEVLGLPFLDNWWQTETGGIMIANLPCMDVRPGSMGKPLPGIEAGIVEVAEGGAVTRARRRRGRSARPAPGLARRCFAATSTRTRATRSASPAAGTSPAISLGAMPTATTGSSAARDDVIKSAGHLIGPFEVESALLEHPAVAEAAVIGVPHPVAGEIVKAFVSLKPGFAASDELRDELLGPRAQASSDRRSRRARSRSSPGVPRTRSGKIMRRLLRARELGLPEGDTSTLEGAA